MVARAQQRTNTERRSAMVVRRDDISIRNDAYNLLVVKVNLDTDLQWAYLIGIR
jgi:hypothetical protein